GCLASVLCRMQRGNRRRQRQKETDDRHAEPACQGFNRHRESPLQQSFTISAQPQTSRRAVQRWSTRPFIVANDGAADPFLMASAQLQAIFVSRPPLAEVPL